MKVFFSWQDLSTYPIRPESTDKWKGMFIDYIWLIEKSHKGKHYSLFAQSTSNVKMFYNIIIMKLFVLGKTFQSCV